VVFPPLIVPAPSVVLPSVKVAVPVAVVGAKVAVNFTAEPYTDGFTDVVRVTVAFALLTVWVSTEDTLLR
jgi:hypothetical protein